MPCQRSESHSAESRAQESAAAADGSTQAGRFPAAQYEKTYQPSVFTGLTLLCITSYSPTAGHTDQQLEAKITPLSTSFFCSPLPPRTYPSLPPYPLLALWYALPSSL